MTKYTTVYYKVRSMMQIDVTMYICDSCFDIINTHINLHTTNFFTVRIL